MSAKCDREILPNEAIFLKNQIPIGSMEKKAARG